MVIMQNIDFYNFLDLRSDIMKDNKKSRIEMRVTPEQKKEIENRAKKAKLSITEYVVRKVLYSKKKRVKDLVLLGEAVTETMELLRIIEEKFGELDSEIVERVDCIWRKLV